MARVVDVAEYILHKTGRITTWKLHKLVYFSQAWHAVWEGRPLFNERIEAWANGPVVRELYKRHAGKFQVGTVRGDSNALDDGERESIDIIVDFYGQYNGQQLSDITHSEKPWQDARKGLGPHVRGQRQISLESMTEYYESLR